MDKRLSVTMLGVAVLAILAVIGKSVVMFVSAVAIGITAYIFRRARARDRVIGVIAAGLGGSIGAEIVHTIYHHASVAEPTTGNGGSFMSAILIGLINVAAIIVVLIVIEAWSKFAGRKAR